MKIGADTYHHYDGKILRFCRSLGRKEMSRRMTWRPVAVLSRLRPGRLLRLPERIFKRRRNHERPYGNHYRPVNHSSELGNPACRFPWSFVAARSANAHQPEGNV